MDSITMISLLSSKSKGRPFQRKDGRLDFLITPNIVVPHDTREREKE